MPSAAPPAPPLEQTRPRPAGRRPRWHGLVALLLVFVGVGVLLYPVVATQYNNAKQHEFAEEYTRQIEQTDPSRLQDALDEAHAYNDGLAGVPILDPWLDQVQGNSPEYDRYLSQLSELDVMARLRVPSIGVDLPVRHGTDEDVLATGVGHLYGTALPVGGPGTHSALTSHTALPDATLFDRLTELKVGDRFYIDVYGETHAYEVDQLKIVLPEETDDLLPVAEQDLVTLVTCTPYAVNTHRLLVRGHRVPFDPATDDVPTGAGLVLQPWMYGLIAAAIGCLAVTAFVVVLSRRRRRRQGSTAA